jgi:hypothetical protein
MPWVWLDASKGVPSTEQRELRRVKKQGLGIRD